jgi:hypothetical protein
MGFNKTWYTKKYIDQSDIIKKHCNQARNQWLTPVILATWKAEIQRIAVGG